MTYYIHQPYGTVSPLAVTTEAPTHHEAYDRIPAYIAASNGEGRQPSFYGIKHQRTDKVRTVTHANDAEAIRAALEAKDQAWKAYVLARAYLRDTLRGVWPLAQSVTVKQAKEEQA